METLLANQGNRMRLFRTALSALVGLTTAISPAFAADYFVQAARPGPVAGVALSVISLQASLTDASTPAPGADADSSPHPRWLHRAGHEAGTETGGAAIDESTIVPLQAAPTAPWKSVGALLASGKVKAGDRIFLNAGYHGPLVIRGHKFTAPVLIAPAPGVVAHVDSILIDASANFVFKDLKVWPSGLNPTNTQIIRSYTTSSDLAFTGLDVRSVPDAPGYMSWSATTWKANKRSGFFLQGNRVTVQNSRVTGVFHGILLSGASSLIEGNVVDGFSADGMRAIGDNSIVRNNRVQNCISIDGTHKDGFQSFSSGPNGPGSGVLKNLVIENNKIIEWASQQTNPLRCRLQGIGMFDGMYDGLRIENNIIVVSAYHGINVSGALNADIRQNTVVNPNGLAGKHPWVRVAAHKNGTPSRNVDLANNFATNITSVTNTANNVIVTNNVRAGAATTEFVGFATQNYALKSTSKAIDAGTATQMTAKDIAGVARFKGKGPDAGAFESQ
jgi:Right handed beta helix region